MIPVLIAFGGLGLLSCAVGVYAMRAEFRAIRVPKLPAKWRRRRGRHRKPWFRRLSTMERWTLTIQRTQERAGIYMEPDWLAVLREQWAFGDVDEFDTAPVGGAASYEQLAPEALEGPTTREFRRIVGASVWGTPVDEWEPVEPQLVVTR